MARHRLIGEILCDLGFLTLAQINEARRAQMERPENKLGEHLLGLGYITPQQLEQGLQKQREESHPGP